jgi:hypothetical protein
LVLSLFDFGGSWPNLGGYFEFLKLSIDFGDLGKIQNQRRAAGSGYLKKFLLKQPTDSAYFQNLKEQLPGSVGERTDSYLSGYLTFVWGKKLENHGYIEERMLWYPRVSI